MTQEDWAGVGTAIGRAMLAFADNHADNRDDDTVLISEVREAVGIAGDPLDREQLLAVLRMDRQNRDQLLQRLSEATHDSAAAAGTTLREVIDAVNAQADWYDLQEALGLPEGTKRDEVVTRVRHLLDDLRTYGTALRSKGAEADKHRLAAETASASLTALQGFVGRALGVDPNQISSGAVHPERGLEQLQLMASQWTNLARFTEQHMHYALGRLSDGDVERFEDACRYAESRNLGSRSEDEAHSPAWIADWTRAWHGDPESWTLALPNPMPTAQADDSASAPEDSAPQASTEQAETGEQAPQDPTPDNGLVHDRR
ncbi:hypothetical protein [Actinokineospora sp. UTMC 2448]|uniref:hypothetical protein n=1 Tax=Actinokineospora sp. UTMC 2448 TaxID=2268449 RepID=UPI0021648A55|nr:hypothetical protein [Actinokineospora sp. UTMC 2448]